MPWKAKLDSILKSRDITLSTKAHLVKAMAFPVVMYGCEIWTIKKASYSVQFSHSVVSNSLWPHESQHARPPCPSPTPAVHSDSRPSSQWCHPAISSSVTPFSSCPQSFSASKSFPMSYFFPSGGQSIRVSASALVLPMNIQDWFLSGLTGLFSLQSKGLSGVFSNTTVQKHQFISIQPSLWSNYHTHAWLLKNIALTIQTTVGKAMSLLFNTLSRFVIAFLPRSRSF